MQSGAAAMIRQIGNIFDIVSAICSRSNRALGCVRQHRVHSLAMPLGMWRRITANDIAINVLPCSAPVLLPGLVLATAFRLLFFLERLVVQISDTQ